MYDLLLKTSAFECRHDRMTAAWVEILGIAGLLYLGALARIPLPFSPAPLTLQTLVVLVAPYFLGGRRSAAGIALYIICGLTAQTSGFTILSVGSGATYGYLAGFAAAPFIIMSLPHSRKGILAAMSVASLLILLLGALWLKIYMQCSGMQAFWMGVVPFLPGDMIKLAIASGIVIRHTKP